MEYGRNVERTSDQYWDRFEEEIRRGMQGLNVGIPIGFDTVARHLANIQPARYDLIGGATGTGKTAFVDNAYLYNPIEFLEKYQETFHRPYFHNLKILYFSIEISPERKLAKLICQKLYDDHGIQIDSKQLFSRGAVGQMPQEILEKILAYKDYYKSILDNYVEFHSSASPNFVYKKVLDHAERYGEVKRGDGNTILSFTPKDPHLITLIVIDHISLIKENKGHRNKKHAMDELSQMLVVFRNDLGFSPVIVSQFNRAIEGMDRKRFSQEEPQLSDFKDTGATQEDADTVMALYNPHRYGLEQHRNYDIVKLGRHYRSLQILKNRDGEDNLSQGMLFMGNIGKFRELPTSKYLKNNPQAYEQIKQVLQNGKQDWNNGELQYGEELLP